jgi:hypothetical protein
MPNTESIISTYQHPERRSAVRSLMARVAVGAIATGAVLGIADKGVDNYHPEKSNPPISAEMKDALTNNPMYEKANSDVEKARKQEHIVRETVEPGETAWEIADKYVDDEHDIRPVANYINEQGSDGVLMAGQQVEIPEKMISEDTLKPHNG